VAKPQSHTIPLTPPERAFVVAVIDDAVKVAADMRAAPRQVCVVTDGMLADEDCAGAVVPMIARWPEEDGMVEIVLLDEPRAAVQRLLGRSRERRRASNRRDRRRLPLFETDDQTFIAGAAALTGREIGRLERMFGDYKLDLPTAREILLRSSREAFFGDVYDMTTGQKRSVMHAYLRNVMAAGFFLDDKAAKPSYYVNPGVLRLACAEWVRAGVCKLRREPAGGRRKYDRVHLDWEVGMWLPPQDRRKPAVKRPPLTAEDEAAIGEVMA
jgi:hypothetical protein